MREREQFGTPIGTFQAVRHRLADIATEVAHCRAFLYDVAERLDAGEEDPRQFPDHDGVVVAVGVVGIRRGALAPGSIPTDCPWEMLNPDREQLGRATPATTSPARRSPWTAARRRPGRGRSRA